MPVSKHRKQHKKKSANYRKELEARKVGEQNRTRKLLLEQREKYRAAMREKSVDVIKSNKTAEMLTATLPQPVSKVKLMSIMPAEFHADFRKSDSYIYAHAEVVGEYTADETDKWPGKHKGVKTWFEVIDADIHILLAINQLKSEVTFPIIQLPQHDNKR
jgi:hypothetical protein